MSRKPIMDDAYFILTTKQLKGWAIMMGVGFSDIPINGQFKKRLYLRLKKHCAEVLK